MIFFRKYFWQFAGTLLAIIAIFATYNVFFLGKLNKDLQIVVNTPISLVEVKPEAIQDIQVSYKGEPVNKVFLLQIQIVNAGNQPIAETDYSRPLSFSFSPKYRLADATITSSQPANIGMTISKISEQSAVVSQTLLNPGDTVSVRFVLIGDDNNTSPQFTIDGRILGVKEVKQVVPKQKTPEWLSFWAGVIAVFLVGLLKDFLKSKMETFVNYIAQYFRKTG